MTRLNGMVMALATLFLTLPGCSRFRTVDRSEIPLAVSPTTASPGDVRLRGFPVKLTYLLPPGPEVRERDSRHWPTRTLEGELLSVDEELVCVEADGFKAVPTHNILEVEIEVHKGTAGLYGIWTALGTASTYTHGPIFRLFSAPVWLVTGTTTTIVAAHGNDLEVTSRSVAETVQYARYPQGLPPALRQKAMEGLVTQPLVGELPGPHDNPPSRPSADATPKESQTPIDGK